MLTRQDALNLLEIGLDYSKANQTDIVLSATESGLARLANGGIHQHVAITNGEARVRAVLGKRVGVATSNRLGVADLRALIDRAIALARVSEPNPEFVSLPHPDTFPSPGLAGALPTPILDLGEEPFTPERRADAAALLMQTAVGNGVVAAGHVSTARTALAVGNSLGIRAFHAWPESSVMAIMTHGDASGYAVWDGSDLADAPVAEVAGRACTKCAAGTEATPIEPGAYTVILEPPAVAEMLSMLAYIGLGATAYQDGRSFMSGKLGERLVGENITLRDDAYHPGMITLPFDFEGVPRQVVPFFEHGVARGVAYDSFTAQKEHRQSTGHALPAPSPYGPLPMHLVLDGGGDTHAALLAGVERGILVTRFHYVNIVHPMETILTGMTRDGTFLIEHGAVTRPVKNLRFTQSILEALRQVTGIERTPTLINQEGMYCLAPALRIEGFSFTS